MFDPEEIKEIEAKALKDKMLGMNYIQKPSQLEVGKYYHLFHIQNLEFHHIFKCAEQTGCMYLGQNRLWATMPGGVPGQVFRNYHIIGPIKLPDLNAYLASQKKEDN